jgi:predicted HTH transcriptional regulator
MIDTTPKGIESIIRGGESITVEFKRSMPPSAELAQAMSAFANSEGGILLIGVEDDGTVVGVPGYRVPQAIEELEKTAESVLFEPIDFNVSKIEGRWVLWVLIPRAPTHLYPIRTADGRIYVREGGSVEKKTSDQVPSLAAVVSKEIVIFVAMSFREGEEPALVDYYKAMERAAQRTKLPIRLERNGSSRRRLRDLT